VLFSIAIAIGPVAVLGIIYQYFLFQEIRAGAREAFVKTMTEKLSELEKVIDYNRNLNELGVVKAYSSRKEAFKDVEDWLAAEDQEIFFVGTSLRGIIGRDEGSRKVCSIIASKAKEKGIVLKFLLTHPAFASLREKHESISRRPDNSIAREILDTVHVLQELGVQPNSIKFFLGTPTCFGAKTSRYMLLNPYPYQQRAMRSFCVVVSKEVGRGEIYSAFELDHFNGVWGSENVVDLEGFDEVSLQKVFNVDAKALFGETINIKGVPERLSKS
jgi:hypothetical protein